MLEFASAAARRAAQLGAHREAASQYARALRWGDGLGPRERALLLEGRGLECYLLDQAAEASAARREAIEIWHELGDRLHFHNENGSPLLRPGMTATMTISLAAGQQATRTLR